MKKKDKSNWTAVIPAAGKGTRLNFDKPKILYPILEKPILYWLIDLLKEYCGHFVFVLSESGKDNVKNYIDKEYTINYDIAIQKSPIGMGDAVLAAENFVRTENALIIWGDQVSIKKRTVEKCIDSHISRINAKFTCPVFRKKNPYIHFVTKNNRLISVLQKREGDNMPEEGLSDCGFFLFKTKTLFDCLKKNIYNKRLIGKQTGEINFLPLFSEFDNEKGETELLEIISEEETIGINDINDVKLLTEYLKKGNL
ncbi:MAG TPA: NTP transferase domain-containing protein [bacterium]|nr:NTP transferase domain-containing protein [bacterium]HPN30092.1 NTP transferase domain-containing protein [bacterium]